VNAVNVIVVDMAGDVVSEIVCSSKTNVYEFVKMLRRKHEHLSSPQLIIKLLVDNVALKPQDRFASVLAEEPFFVTMVTQECSYELQFRGDGFVQVANLDGIPFGNDARTVSAEFYPTAAVFTNLVSWGDGHTTSRRFSLHLVPSGGRMLPSFCGQNNDHFKGGPHGVPLNRWSHAAVTYDGAGRIKVFVNGACVGTANAGTLDTAGGQNLFIGKNTQNRPDEYFRGSVASARIWDKALSLEEIQLLHSGSEVPEMGLVADWIFAPQGDTVLSDATAGGHDGTMTAVEWAIRQPES